MARKGRRQKLKNGCEFDLLYGRAIYCYLKKSGVKKFIKRALNKRQRRENEKTDKED